MPTKVCNKCGRELPLDSFWRSAATPDGHIYHCKECGSLLNKATKRHPTSRWKSHIRKKFNLSEEDYIQMLEKQNEVCAICGQPESGTFKGSIRRLAVDHNHSTGEIRGLLCRRCNLGVGYFNDDEELIRKVLSYLGGS
jgi:hypothetical protein